MTSVNYRPLILSWGPARFQRHLAEIVKGHDLLFIGKGLYLTPEILRSVRQQGIPVLLWYGDIRPQPEPWLIDLLAEVDAFFMSSRGEVLAHYFKQGRPQLAAYYFNPADPDLALVNPPLEREYEVSFTARFSRIESPERQAVIQALKNRPEVHFFGGADRSWAYNIGLRVLRRLKPMALPNEVADQAYIEVIRRTGIGIGINALPDIPGYSSDRLVNYLNFGSCFLSAWFPGVETLFAVGQELLVFHSLAEMDDLLNYYTQNPAARDQIGLAGQARVLSDYSAQAITRMMLNTLKQRHTKDYEWSECLRL